MVGVQVCRLCLVMDVKFHNLQSYPMESYFNSVIGTGNALSSRNLPPYVCYECAALVKKFYFFKQKCLRSQAVLHGITDEVGKLSRKAIKVIDRKSLHIASPLELVIMPQVNIIDYQYSNNKMELDGVLDEVKPYLSESGIKEEDVEYLIIISDNGLSSDDDEPLSHYIDQKEEKKETKIKGLEKVLEDLKAHKGQKKKTEIEDVEEVLEDLEGHQKDQQKETEIEDVEEVLEGLEFEQVTDDILEPDKKTGRTGVTPKKPLKNAGLLIEGISDVQQYATVICLTIEEQIEDINKRKETPNYLNSPYKCELCFKGFRDTGAWKLHLSRHSPTAGDIECRICKFRFKKRGDMLGHALRHQKKYICKSCSFISTSTTQAKQHEGWHRGVTFTCEFCGEMFIAWTSYMSHVRIKHPSDTICEICGYSFVNKFGLARHKALMHKDVLEKAEENKEEGPYCKECDVKFLSTEAFKRHMVMSVKHTNNSDFSKGCRTCGEKFFTYEDLRLHQRKEHPWNNWPKNYKRKVVNRRKKKWPAKCEYCPQEVSSGQERWSHICQEHPDKKYPVAKNYVCDICGRRYSCNSLLEYHKRTHFNERNYKCTQCDKAFLTKSHLQVHEGITHSDERSFLCSVCSKTFKCKGSLAKHLKFHGEKSYICEMCGECVSSYNELKLHVRTEHQ